VGDDFGLADDGRSAGGLQPMGLIHHDEAKGARRRTLADQGEQLGRVDLRAIHLVPVKQLDAEGALQLLNALELARPIRTDEETDARQAHREGQ
jgi:hypothetical protein